MPHLGAGVADSSRNDAAWAGVDAGGVEGEGGSQAEGSARERSRFPVGVAGDAPDRKLKHRYRDVGTAMGIQIIAF